jgi:chromosome partitioning protein
MKLTIAVSNQKGGVGKTTTSINLGACLAMSGMKTLIIDLDPQGNATSGLGMEATDESNIYAALIEQSATNGRVQLTDVDNLHIIPADINLIGVEVEIRSDENREFMLKNMIASLHDEFSFIIIDCPPSLGLLTVNALTAADSVIIPLQTEYYALEGLRQLLNTIDMIRGSFNPALEIEGLLFTMYDSRTSLSNQVVEEVRANYKSAIFGTIIPRNIRLSEAPSHGLPISMYDMKSKGSDAYVDLARELIERNKERFNRG